MDNFIEFISFPLVHDHRGNLVFLQSGILPFEMKRIYYLFDVPNSASRGGHSHLEQHEILVALSGSFEVILDNGKEKTSVILNKPEVGLLIKNGVWRDLQKFSAGAVCLVISSGIYIEEDYIREYDVFLASKNETTLPRIIT